MGKWWKLLEVVTDAVTDISRVPELIKDAKDVMNGNSELKSHLAQIKTGQGKSLILGLTSSACNHGISG